MARLAQAKSRLGQVRAAARREAAIRDPRGGRPIALVTGNCQADVLRAMLDLSPGFADEYRTVRVAPVHEMSAAEGRQLLRLMPHVGLYLPHPVRDGYRDMVIGHEELAARAAPGCRVIRVPPIYYEGLFPFQVNVHEPPEQVSRPAPLTTYHDLRLLHFAAQPGATVPSVVEGIEGFTPPADALRQLAADSADRLVERDDRVDVPVAAPFLERVKTHRSLYSVNHPDSGSLQLIADGVLTELGLPPLDQHPAIDPLGRIVTPIDAHVGDALDLAYPPEPAWRVDGRPVAWDEVVRTQLAWYAQTPGLIDAGLREHAERLDALGLKG